MSMQSLVMGNRALTNRVMSRIPASSHVRRGEKYALSVAGSALARTKAYPDFLSVTNGGTHRLSSVDDFNELPVMDKRSYIDPYPLRDRCLDGRVAGAYTIEKSSGHSGASYYWLRLPQEDAMFPKYLEYAFVQFYGMDKRSTLVVITLALGTWTSGEKMAQALREVAAAGGYHLTVMAPGTDLDEILEIVRDLGPEYEQVVMVGYPPFLKTVLDEGERQGFDWKSLRVRLGLGGEGYSEQWREHVATIIGVDSRRDLLAISGGYGAADIGMSIGREYPLTVMIRKMCMDDPALGAALFCDSRGRNSMLPGLLQYNPATCYVEDIAKELVFTVLSGVPLVRYNIHDYGAVIPYEEMMRTLREHGYDVVSRLAEIGYGQEQIWRLPFFYVYGRSDGTVSIVGANIFPENIQAILCEKGDKGILRYMLSIETTRTYSLRLAIYLEHTSDRLTEAQADDLARGYYPMLVSGLRRLNQDFRDAHDDNPQAADPIVRTYARDTGPFAGKKTIKNHYIC